MTNLNKMKIVGLGHRKFCGKDTIAKFLCTEYRLRNPKSNVVRRGFAYKLKQTCYELYGWAGLRSPEYYDQYPDNKEDFLPLIGKTVRQIWIEVGMALRGVYHATWIDC